MTTSKSNSENNNQQQEQNSADNTFELSIPHRSELTQQQQHQLAQRRTETLQDQKNLVEDGFQRLENGQATVEFETNQPLLPEITQELTRKGYNYYYQYKYDSTRPDSNRCHVIISTESSGFPVDNMHHNESLYNMTRELDRSLHRFNKMLGSFYDRPFFSSFPRLL